MAANASPPARPNIVFIVADDLGWGDVRLARRRDQGNPAPSSERLGHDGILLEQHYVAPVCTPTRAQFMSGRYASRFGITVPQDERAFPFGTVTLASALQESGYDTALIGKWHLGGQPADGPLKFGFDHSYGTLHGACGPYNHLYHDAKPTWHRNEEYIQEKGHATDLITQEAIKWIEARSDKPFFLYLPYTAPHVPLDEPAQWLNLYADRPDPGATGFIPRAFPTWMTASARWSRRSTAPASAPIPSSSSPATTARGAARGIPRTIRPASRRASARRCAGRKATSTRGASACQLLINNWPGHLAPRAALDSPIHAVDWLPTFAALAGYHCPTDLKRGMAGMSGPR